MGKSNKKKTVLSVILALAIIIVAIGAYILFGVVGVESKRTFPTSESVSANVQSGKTVVDSDATYQTMNGFGASSCWWSQEVGTWDNCNDIMSLLYSKDKGIGLNIYRYNLGAGSKGDDTITLKSRQTEDFLNDDGTYNFDADKGARTALATAKSLAGDDMQVELFCNSAPVSMTKNGKGYCNAVKDNDAEWISNLDPSNYEKFATYCYDCTDYFIKDGYRVTGISPINEPQYQWSAWYNDDGTVSCNQEGCYYSKKEARDLLNVFVKKFKESDIDKTGCKVTMFESGATEGKGKTAAAYMDCILGKGPKYVFKNQALRKYFTSVSTHSYWSDTNEKKSAAEYLSKVYSNYDIACTEYCQMTNDENTGVFDLISKEENGTNGMTIEYGVQMAKVIVDDLTILNAKEWDWWIACSFGTYTDGLVYINEDNHSDVKTSKRLWCLGNFSKFVDEGAVRIACSSGNESLQSVAFKNTDGSTVIVYVNATDSDINTSLDGTLSDNALVYLTDKSHDLAAVSDTVNGNSLSVPSMSVETVVIK